MIFLLGSAGKASLSLRMSEASDAACAKDLVDLLFIFLFSQRFLASSICFLGRHVGIGGGTFATRFLLPLSLLGGPAIANCVWIFYLREMLLAEFSLS